MSSKALHRLAGGLLAGLLALFAAVVVATPAWAVAPAVSYANVDNAAQFVEAVFGKQAEGVTASEAGASPQVVTVTKNPSGTTGGIIDEASAPVWVNLTTPITLDIEEGVTITANDTLVVTGDTLTIEGEGTLTGTGSSALSASGGQPVLCVGLASGVVPETAVTGMNESYPGALIMNGGTINNSGESEAAMAVLVLNGNAQINDGATVANTAKKAASGTSCALVVGVPTTSNGAYTYTAACTVNEGAKVSGGANNGIGVFGVGQLTVDGGEISGGATASAISVDMGVSSSPTGATSIAATNPKVTITGGTIGGSTCGNGIWVGDQSGTSGANKTGKAEVSVSGSAVVQGSNAAIVDNVVGSLNISGGTLLGKTGTDPLTIANVKPVVSGGQFSNPVNPSYLANTVKNMGVFPKRGTEPVTYGYFDGEVPATATASVPINSTNTAKTISVVDTIVWTGTQSGIGYTEPTESPVQAALKDLGISSGTLYNAVAQSSLTDGNLYVIYYGDPSVGFDVTAKVGSTTMTGTAVGNTADVSGNGFYVSTIELTAAGDLSVVVSDGPTQSDPTPVPVSGITWYNAASGSGSGVTGDSPVTVYFEANAEATSYTLPTIQPNPLQKGPQPTAIGWYQLTPIVANNKTTYDAALYDGTEWAPTASGMTTLMAAYTTATVKGNVTGELTITPTNVTATKNAAQAILTLTVGPRATRGSVLLANLASDAKLNINNESKLQPTIADAAAIVAETAGTGLTSNCKFNTYSAASSGAEWTTTEASGVSAALAPVAEGETNPVIDGDTVTFTLDLSIDPKTFTLPASNPIALTVDLGSSLGVKGVMGGTATAPTITTEPAATFNVFTGVQVTTIGNGTVAQTVDANGNVTLTATPTNGAKFIGWQDKLGNNLSTSNPWTLTPAAVTSLNATLDGNSLFAFFEGGTEPTPPAPTGEIAVYRLYNTATQEHLLTASTVEFNQLIAGGQWIKDGYDANPSGIAFYELAASDEGTPVYRLYDEATNTHLYTANVIEKNALAAQGWHEDFNGQAMFKAPTTSSYPVYRLYNGNLPLNVSHLWTASYNEFNTLRNLPVSQRWTPEPNAEGIAWLACGVPTGPEA